MFLKQRRQREKNLENVEIEFSEKGIQFRLKNELNCLSGVLYVSALSILQGLSEAFLLSSLFCRREF